jgi:predicted O-methyltransferase YrrM
MNIKLILIISIIFNIILIIYFNKKKIKKYFYKSNIEKIDICDLDDSFKLVEISKNLYKPKNEAIVRSFSITPKNQIIGMTSDLEGWIISTISKKSSNIFEFGTCSGKTTFLMGLNSRENAKITTITLDPNEISSISKEKEDNKISFRNIKNESVYDKFLFSGNEVEKKINVIFQNSLDFDCNKLINSMDLIFIDGGHTYSVVKNDSEKAFQMISKKGIILWHDYVPGKESAKDVVKYINEISKKKKLYSINGTTLVYFKNE